MKYLSRSYCNGAAALEGTATAHFRDGQSGHCIALPFMPPGERQLPVGIFDTGPFPPAASQERSVVPAPCWERPCEPTAAALSTQFAASSLCLLLCNLMHGDTPLRPSKKMHPHGCMTHHDADWIWLCQGHATLKPPARMVEGSTHAPIQQFMKIRRPGWDTMKPETHGKLGRYLRLRALWMMLKTQNNTVACYRNIVWMLRPQS